MARRLHLKKLLINEISIFIYLWVIYLFFPMLFDLERGEFSISLGKVTFTAYYIILASLNNFYLIPRYVSNGRYLTYLGVILTTLAGFSIFDETVIEYLLNYERGLSLSTRGAAYSFIRMGTIVILFGSFKLFWDYQNKLRKISSLEKERIESELKFLKSQINPHVMFNNLNSIYYYALENSEKVPTMILKLSEIMRYMIYEANERLVSLEKELEYIRNFIELQKIRLEERGTIAFSVDGDPGNYQIAPLLLISFIENSFKHSMETRSDDIWIEIEITISDDQLHFSARNNWSEPQSPGDRPSSSGIGLQNVKKRLQLIYPGQHTLEIKKSEELFDVSLTLSLKDE